MRQTAVVTVCLLFLSGLAHADHAAKKESPSAESAPAGSTMRNTDVVQMFKAGLSEKVIITSIRQVPAKDFDLTPAGLIALKKAGLSDSVIEVMQEGDAPLSVPSVVGKYRRKPRSPDFIAPLGPDGKPVSPGKSTDLLELRPDGAFSFNIDGKQIDGSYRVQSGTLTLTVAGTSETIKGRFAENSWRYTDGSDWEKQAEAAPRAPAPVVAAPASSSATPSSPCADVDYQGVIQAVTGGGEMSGWNAYGGRVRNRASYTKEVDFAWVMNGRQETGTFRIPAGQFIDVNLGQGRRPPTQVRIVTCR